MIKINIKIINNFIKVKQYTILEMYNDIYLYLLNNMTSDFLKLSDVYNQFIELLASKYNVDRNNLHKFLSEKDICTIFMGLQGFINFVINTLLITDNKSIIYNNWKLNGIKDDFLEVAINE